MVENSSDMQFVDWTRYLKKLFQKISSNCNENTNFYEYPEIPFSNNKSVYPGKVVAIETFLKFIEM